MTIYNTTPHAVNVVDKDSRKITATYEPDKTKVIRGSHLLGYEKEPLLDGSKVFQQGIYFADEKQWRECNFKAGDVVITSTIGAEQIKHFAQRDGVRVLIPASGPEQCLRENGQIVGVYFFLEI